MDTFLNTATEDFTLDFTWPDTDDVLFDDTAPRLEKVLVKDGYVELELTEESDLATTGAILIDGEPVVWELDESRYKLVTTTPLDIGAYTLEIGTALTDLAGLPITEPFANPIAIDPLTPRWVVYLAPDPREVSASTINNDLGFHGLEHDPETGLVYVRNRHFDPELGRFISQDPLGYIDGPSLYQFALNNPVNFADPTGRTVQYNWHHILPTAVFDFSGGNPPVIAELGLRLDPAVDIDSSEFGRVMTRNQHMGGGTPHGRYNNWWTRRLEQWKMDNPQRQVLRRADIDELLKDMPDELRRFNSRGRPSGVGYKRWTAARGMQEKMAANARALRARPRANPRSGSGIKVRSLVVLEVLGTLVRALELANEAEALRQRQEYMVSLYQYRGYSDEEIDKLLELRTRLETVASPTIRVLGTPVENLQFNQQWNLYLLSIPEDVIVPDEDMDFLHTSLPMANPNDA